MAERLLPPNATPLELALESAVAGLGALPTPHRDLWSAERCPEALLPWLAWAMRVDLWDPSWSAARKRQVILAAADVHRRRGTRAAVERALAAVWGEARLREWHEYGGEPHTYRVDLQVEEPYFDLEHEWTRVERALAAAAPARAHVDAIAVAIATRGEWRIGLTTASGELTEVLPYTVFEAEDRGGLRYGAAATSVETTTVQPMEAA